jgi:hypothetical protein
MSMARSQYYVRFHVPQPADSSKAFATKRRAIEDFAVLSTLNTCGKLSQKIPRFATEKEHQWQTES